LIGKFAPIDDCVFQFVRKTDLSIVINIFYSDNEFVLYLVLSESASLGNDMDYDCWHATLGYLFKVEVYQTLYVDGYLIPDYQSTFTYNPYTLSKSKHKVRKPIESGLTEVFELIHPDFCSPFLT
jgi:hypothetical protein